MTDLETKAFAIRKSFIQTAARVDPSHVASSLSCIDIVTALYFGGILNYDPKNPEMPNRDRFVLSKGHAALALYTVLCEAGFFTKESLYTYCKPGTIFGGHVSEDVPGVECSTGSLGHGLSFAVGLALSARLKKEDWLTYVITGDGECQEGSIWEAAMSIANFNLTNLIWIIDRNNLQIEGSTEKLMALEPLKEKLLSFGFEVISVDGHSLVELSKALTLRGGGGRIKNPLVIIAHTIKGKGAPCLENLETSHSRKPSREEYERMFEMYGINKETET